MDQIKELKAQVYDCIAQRENIMQLDEVIKNKMKELNDQIKKIVESQKVGEKADGKPE